MTEGASPVSEASRSATSGATALGVRPFSLHTAVTTYGANVGAAVLSLVSVLITSRALGPTGRGDVVFLTTVAGISAQLALLGVSRAVANFAPAEPEARPAVASNSLLLSAILGAMAIGAVELLMALVPSAGAHEPLVRRWIALGAIPVVVFEACIWQLLRAADDHSIVNVAWVTSPVVNVVGNGLLALAGVLTATLAVCMWVTGQVVATLIMVAALSLRHSGFGRPDRRLTRRMLGFGLKTYASSIMLVGNYRLDQWLLGAFKNPTQVGIYSVAVAWSEGLFFLPTALVQMQHPDFVRGTPRQAAWRAARITRACLILTAGMAAVMWVAAPFLCVHVFGPGFRGSVNQLRILTVGSLGIAAMKLLGDVLTAQRKPMLESAAIAVAFATIVPLDLVLIPSHSGMGAAIGSAIAYSAGGAAVALIFVRALPARVHELLPHTADARWAVARLRAALG